VKNLFTNPFARTRVAFGNLHRRAARYLAAAKPSLAEGTRASSGIRRRTLGREFLVADGEDNSSPKCSNLGGEVSGALSLSLSASSSLLSRSHRAREGLMTRAK